jgi:hypothetical protein
MRGKPFSKEHKGGRPKGTPNKITKSVKDAIFESFQSLQESKEHSLTAWAKDNLTEFYKIASKLIPVELAGGVDVTIKDVSDTKFIIKPKGK